MEDPRRALHLVRGGDVETVDAVVQTQMLAQLHHVGIAVDAPSRRARIADSETGVRERRVAELVDGFVGGCRRVSADVRRGDGHGAADPPNMPVSTASGDSPCRAASYRPAVEATTAARDGTTQMRWPPLPIAANARVGGSVAQSATSHH